MGEVVEGLERALAELEERRIAFHGVLHSAGADFASAERRLRRTLGGFSLDRWHALTDGRASIRSPASGRAANLAARRAPGVEAALRDLGAARIAWCQRIDQGRTALDQAEQTVKAFGSFVDVHRPSIEQMTRTAGPGRAALQHQRLHTADPRIALQEKASEQEIPLVSTRQTVKEYQRRLVQLDAEHSRAKERLETARRKRDEVVAAHEQQVTDAESEVEKTVVAMATAIGSELAANLLDLDLGRVKQLVRRANTAQ